MLHFHFGNSQKVVSGHAVSINNDPVEIGNVVAYNVQDSSILNADVFYDGKFILTVDGRTEIDLELTALGYEPHRVRINLDSESVEVGSLVLQYNTLETVTISSRAQIYEQKGSDLKIDVQNSTLSQLGTAIDVLQNTPKVITTSAGTIQVVGKGSALVYINGQLISSTQILQNLSSLDISTIEVLENPPAKYDASGNAVINIKTKNKGLEGYKVDINAEHGRGRHWRSYFKTDGYFKKGKVAAQGGLGIRPITFTARNDYARRYSDDVENIFIDNKYKYTIDRNAYDYYFKSTIDLNETNTIFINYLGGQSTSDRDGLNTNVYTSDINPGFNLNTNITGPFDQENNTLHLKSDHVLSSNSAHLSLSAQYSDYSLYRVENIDQNLVRNNITTPLDRKTTNTNDIAIWSQQIDFTKKINDKLSFDVGVKHAVTNNSSKLGFDRIDQNGNVDQIEDFSTDFSYEERIYAQYISSTFSIRDYNLNIGLRNEITNSTGIDALDEGNPYEYKNNRLFPSLSISKPIKGKTYTLSYSERIQRPAFQDLNPFTFYADSLMSFNGNPQLLPEFSKSITLSSNLSFGNASLSYTRIENKINTVIEVFDLENQARFTLLRDNTIRTEEYSLSLSRSFQYKKYSSYWMLVGRYENHQYYDQDVIVSNKKPGVYLYTSQNISLPWDIGFTMTYQMTSPRVDGLYTDQTISALGFSFTKSMMNNSLKVRLIGNDIFDNFKFIGTASVYSNEWEYLSAGDYQYLKLSLSLSLGQLKSGKLQWGKVSNEEVGRINKQ